MKERDNLVVKYDNSFNKTSLSLLTKVQSNILMAVLQRMGEHIKHDQSGDECYVATYSFREIREMTNSPNLQANQIRKIFDQLLDTKVEFFEEDRYTKANLFSHYSLIGKSTSEIALSRELTKKLTISNNQYTILKVDEYVDLPSTYSKEIYRLLRQFRHSGIRIISKDELVQLLNPPKSYNEYNVIRKVIIPAIEANKEYFENLAVNIPGNELPQVIKFTFTPHKRINNKQKSNLDEQSDILKQYIIENQK